MGQLTTHVLDTHAGKPAAELTIELWQQQDSGWERLKTVVTNADGRVDGPVLDKAEFNIGVYELRFMAGDYLKRHTVSAPDPLFLDVVPVRFGINDAGSHYHVPLLLSAHGYSTYRGS